MCCESLETQKCWSQKPGALHGIIQVNHCAGPWVYKEKNGFDGSRVCLMSHSLQYHNLLWGMVWQLPHHLPNNILSIIIILIGHMIFTSAAGSIIEVQNSGVASKCVSPFHSRECFPLGKWK